MAYSQSYYDDIRRRLHAVLLAVGDRLPRGTQIFVSEALDANELGVALETLVEVLASSGAPVAYQIVVEMACLASTMQTECDVEGQLAMMITDGDSP